mgnify:CR=1 FL=1
MPNYAIAKPIRAMNDYDANLSEEDRRRQRKESKRPWWERERKTAYCMMSSSPMQTKVNSEKW